MKRRPFSFSSTMYPQPPAPSLPPPPSSAAASSASARIPRGGASSSSSKAGSGSGSGSGRRPYDRSVSALEKGYDDDAASSAPSGGIPPPDADEHDDTWNYALLLALYTLQGIPMGLSASIPFLIQQKVKVLAESAASHAAAGVATDAAAAAAAAAHHHHPSVAKMAYNAQAIFALCSWPFSLKLLWAPVVDAVFWRRFGRRKSWLVPVQALAGVLMVTGSGYVERQLGLGHLPLPGAGVGGAVGGGVADVARDLKDAAAAAAGGAGGETASKAAASASAVASTAAAAAASVAEDAHFDVKGITAFFFALYFLMATQDIAVDGWALTMLSKKNRGRGPVCNSIGQNMGYFLSFVGFLALNDADSSENLWRPLLGWESKPGVGIVSLGGFIKFCGFMMLAITTFVAVFKREVPLPKPPPLETGVGLFRRKSNEQVEEDAELDAAELGLHETYHRLWAVCQLPAVRWLFLILITYRLPTALSDNVKFLKAVEFGLSKQTTALLSPTLILPLGIAVPIIAAKVWHGNPLRQFMDAYKVRVTIVALFDVLMLLAVRSLRNNTDPSSKLIFWLSIIGSTGLQAIVHSLQFNAQMTFFAHRVDPAIGGSYMTLLNTAANLGGTWPASFVMYLVGQLTVPPDCITDATGAEVCAGGRDAYFPLQLALSVLGCTWIFFLGDRVKHVASLPDDAWRTHIGEGDFVEAELGDKEKKNPKSE